MLVSGRVIPGPEPTGRYDGCGKSAFGVADLVGNVWQYTSWFADARTRRVVLKGGSNYHAQAEVTPTSRKNWYFPQARQNLTLHNVMLLMDESYERAGTVGFRCVADVPPPGRYT